MGHIYEPVKSWHIIYTIMRPEGDLVQEPVKFKTVAELRNFFFEHKRLGEAVGYVITKNRTPGFNDNRITGKLSFEYIDQTTSGRNDFDNVNQFVKFLEDHPQLARLVEYVKKK